MLGTVLDTSEKMVKERTLAPLWGVQRLWKVSASLGVGERTV